MTTFADLVTLTVNQTRRPEIQTLTESAIRSAVRRAHHVDFFSRDLRVQTLLYPVGHKMFYDFPNISNTLQPRLRSIKNVFTMTDDGEHQIEQLEYRTPDDLYDADGAPRRYIYTLIGDTLRCFFDMPTGRADVYYYANPVLSSGSFSSWIADEYPDEIANWAAAIVFNRTGFVEQASQYLRDYVEPFKNDLVASHILGNA